MEIGNFLSFLTEVVDTAREVGATLEEWSDEHQKRSRRRRDDRLASYSNEQYEYFRKDYEKHPERYDVVSRADVKAARKRIRSRR
ncbi:MAG: hypothetical protein FWH35_00770 [Treponema sp.]|nr:hypothetical protein [Treponema sp.]